MQANPKQSTRTRGRKFFLYVPSIMTKKVLFDIQLPIAGTYQEFTPNYLSLKKYSFYRLGKLLVAIKILTAYIVYLFDISNWLRNYGRTKYSSGNMAKLF